MGLSKSKQTTKSTETLAPSEKYAPYIDANLQRMQQRQQQEDGLYAKYLPQAEKSFTYYGDTLAGKYMDGNPYVQSQIDQTNANVRDEVASQFSQAGRYGSDYNVSELARRLSNNESNIRFANWQAERQAQERAAAANLAGSAQIIGMPGNLSAQDAATLNALIGKYATSNRTDVTKSSPSLLSLLAAAGQTAGTVISGGA